MAEERVAFDASCAEYEAKKAELMQRVQQQQASVRQIVECARVPSLEADSRYMIRLVVSLGEDIMYVCWIVYA